MARLPRQPRPHGDHGEAWWEGVKRSARPLHRPQDVGARQSAVSAGLTRDGGQALPAARTESRRVHDGGAALAIPQELIGTRVRAERPSARRPGSLREDPVGTPAIAKDWERALRTGRVAPDMVIDLHGHHLASAHSALSHALDRAEAAKARIILVIAGKQRGPDEAPRGAIRRELATWLAHSGHAGRILAVRNAHPRHGGAGAVYVVLRKT